MELGGNFFSGVMVMSVNDLGKFEFVGEFCLFCG